MYRSKFEAQIAAWLKKNNIGFNYEPCVLNYIVPESKHRYTPDWEIGKQQKKKIVYESKGRFTAADRKKMLLVRKSNPDIIIRMIFQNSNVTLSKVSKTTYAAWCIKNGFEWCDFRKGIPKEWINGTKDS